MRVKREEDGERRAQNKRGNTRDTRVKGAMRKMVVQHIGNNVISIFRVLLFSPDVRDVEGRRR